MQIREEYRPHLITAGLIGGMVAAQAIISDRITRLLTQGGLLLLLASHLDQPFQRPAVVPPPPPLLPISEDGRHLANGWRRFVLASNGTFQLSRHQTVPTPYRRIVENNSIYDLTIAPKLDPMIQYGETEAVSYRNVVYLITLPISSYKIYRISLKEGQTIDHLRWSRCDRKLAIGLVE